MGLAEKLRSERIDLRVTPSDKEMIQEAAAMRNQSMADFMIASGVAAAAEALADRRHFVLPDAQWKAFIAALDAPTHDKPRLKGLLKTPSALE